MFEQRLHREFHAPAERRSSDSPDHTLEILDSDSGKAVLDAKGHLGRFTFAGLFHRFVGMGVGLAFVVAWVAIGSAELQGQEEDAEQSVSTTEPQMVYPSRSSEEEEEGAQSELYADLMPDSGSGVGMAVTILGYLIILGGMAVAAWYLFKRGVIRKPFSSSEGKLKVAESRMLGNRQYIMVVEYEDKKILLGVGPGKIDYLTSLDGYRSSFPSIEPEIARTSVQEIA